MLLSKTNESQTTLNKGRGHVSHPTWLPVIFLFFTSILVPRHLLWTPVLLRTQFQGKPKNKLKFFGLALNCQFEIFLNKISHINRTVDCLSAINQALPWVPHTASSFNIIDNLGIADAKGSHYSPLYWPWIMTVHSSSFFKRKCPIKWVKNGYFT